MQHEDRCQPLKKRLISTVSGTQAREQRLAPEKFSAGSLVSITFTATSGVKYLSPGTETYVLVHIVDKFCEG